MQTSHSRTRIKYTSLALATVAGAAVMVVELGVARVLTPVFGGSISVWAIVIATTMLALAAGYAFGGYRADRSGGLVVANRAAAIGAVFCAIIPFIRLTLIHYTIDLSTISGASVAAIVLIAPSLFFLSQVSPALIRGLADNGVTHVGVTAGGIYAVSTLGSLVGTLAAVWLFLYLPLMTGFVVTAVLVMIPVILLRPLAGISVLVIGVGVLGLSMLQSTAQITGQNANGQHFRLLEKRNSLYGEIRVVEQEERFRYMIVNGFDQGGVDRRTGRSAYTFADGLIGLGRLYQRQLSSALIIGVGPGVIARTLQDAGLRVDSVEIDATVVAVAREYFNYEGDAVVDDGRRYLQRSDRNWDMVVVDAFSGGSPPWQLYTREAFALYAEHLNTGGVVVLNFIGSHLDPEQIGALEAVVGTAREVFPTVDVYPDPWEPDDYPTRNIFIAASFGTRQEARHRGDPMDAESLSQAIARMEPVSLEKGRTLTDESAPLEPLVRRTTEHLRSRSREYLPLNVLFE